MVKVLSSVVRGPLEPHVTGFAAQLLGLGYSRTSAAQHVCFIAHLDRWMAAQGVGVDGLSGPVIERYLGHRRAAGYRQYRSVKALRPLLDYLGPLGVLPVPQQVPAGPVEELLGRFRDYLLGERGLTPGTARGYVDCVRPFVATRLRGDVLDLAGITAADVPGFVLVACPARAVGSAKLIVCGLRSLLGWLHLTGQRPVPLAAAVPSVAGWRLSGVPKGLEPGQLRRLLAAPDRRTSTGRRDYVVAAGAAGVAGRGGRLPGAGRRRLAPRRDHRPGKGARAERLPLPVQVGAAIAAYLERGRPSTAQGRTVFVRVHAPHRALTTGAVTMIVFDAAQRAGLGRMHAHRLRHTAATAMLRAGSPLSEVGQVLRHRSPLSTAIYAKVDREALAVLARPWPVTPTGGVS